MFRPVKVFDVRQTDGKPLPELASSLSGNVPNYEAFMEALRRSAPMPITFEAMAADTDGYFSADHQKIAIRQGMSEVQTVSATVHEIAHSKLHDPKKYEMLPSWKVVQESEGGTKHDFKLIFVHITPIHIRSKLFGFFFCGKIQLEIMFGSTFTLLHNLP